MPPMQSIARPVGDVSVKRAAEALKQSFDDLVSMANISVSAAAGPDIPEAFIALAHRAESVGWPLDIAEEAIHHLAQEYLGARGTFSD